MSDFLKRLFGRAQGPSVPPIREPDDFGATHVQSAKPDPMAARTIAAKEIAAHLITAISDSETAEVLMLASTGALAGYACHLNARIRFLNLPRDQRQMNDYISATDKDGATLYFGDLINRPLAEDPSSFWAIILRQAQSLGGTDVSKVDEIFGHVVRTVGTFDFAIPRLPQGQRLTVTLQSLVARFWPEIAPILIRRAGDPEGWPVSLGLAAGEIMEMIRPDFDPSVSLKILMECAVPASKFALLPADDARFPLRGKPA